MKRKLSFLVAVMMVLSMLPAMNVFAVDAKIDLKVTETLTAATGGARPIGFEYDNSTIGTAPKYTLTVLDTNGATHDGTGIGSATFTISLEEGLRFLEISDMALALGVNPADVTGGNVIPVNDYTPAAADEGFNYTITRDNARKIIITVGSMSFPTSGTGKTKQISFGLPVEVVSDSKLGISSSSSVTGFQAASASANPVATAVAVDTTSIDKINFSYGASYKAPDQQAEHSFKKEINTIAPIFKVEVENKGTSTRTLGSILNGKTFDINLTNATYLEDEDFKDFFDKHAVATPKFNVTSSNVATATYNNDSTDTVIRGTLEAGTVYTMAVEGERKLRITFGNDTTNLNVGEKRTINIPLPIKITGTGNVYATSSQQGAQDLAGVNSGNNILIAKGLSGDLYNVSIKDTNFTTAKTLELARITLKELSLNGVDPSKAITFTAPQGFKWVDTIDSSDDYTATGKYGFTGTGTDVAGGSADFTISSDKEVLTLDAGTISKSSPYDENGEIIFDHLTLEREDSIANTPLGDIVVRVQFYSDGKRVTERLTVGKFEDKKVTLKAEDVAEDKIPKIVAGKWYSDIEDERMETLEFTLSENIAGIWNDRHEVELKLSSGAKFRQVEVLKGTNFKSSPNNARVSVNNGTLLIKGLRKDDDYSKYPLTIKMRAWVSVEAGTTGDITLSSTEDNEAFAAEVSCVIAKAIAPFELELEPTDINLGIMKIALGDITIKENVAGGLTKVGSNDHKGIDRKYNFLIGGPRDYARFREAGKAEVVSGDIVIDSLKITKSNSIYNNSLYDEGVLALAIKRESTKPSVVKLTGMTMDADRNIPAGKLDLRVYGAVAANYHTDPADKDASTYMGSISNGYPLTLGFVEIDKGYGLFGTQYLATGDDNYYVNIVTAPVDQDNKYTTEVSIKIGSKEITSNKVVNELDVAAFIQDDYTMVPVRAVAVAMGISDSQVQWSPNTKTVTILDTNRGRNAQFTVGSNKILVNGMEVEFVGPSVMIVEGRAFLPFRALGEVVLGCPVSWDQETQTAYFNQVGTELVKANTTEEAAA